MIVHTHLSSKELKIGDKVVTSKGCRIKGNPGVLEIVETNKKWSQYDAAMCKKLDGSIKMFLVKNLKLYKPTKSVFKKEV